MIFEPGGKVVCIDPIGSLIKNQIYTVGEVRTELYKDCSITWLNLVELGLEYRDYRFKLYMNDTDPITTGVQMPLPREPEKTDFIKDKNMTLPKDSAIRKNYPMMSGCLKYFPAALAGVAHISKLGNDKHNPGEPLHHARGKSMDHSDCIVRHLVDAEDLLAAFKRSCKDVTPEMILMEANQLAWRALAYSQLIQEQFGAPLAPGARLPNDNFKGSP